MKIVVVFLNKLLLKPVLSLYYETSLCMVVQIILIYKMKFLAPVGGLRIVDPVFIMKIKV